MADFKVEYKEKKVELTREYGFGEHTIVKDGKKDKKVTVLRLTELNGHDNVAMSKQIDNGKLAGYLQIAMSASIEYDEALSLADVDSNKLSGALADF